MLIPLFHISYFMIPAEAPKSRKHPSPISYSLSPISPPPLYAFILAPSSSTVKIHAAIFPAGIERNSSQ